MNTCWMSLGAAKPHELGTGLHCLMCDVKRREEAKQNTGAVAMGLQRPAAPRVGVSA